jgi:hypothetical protein
MTLNQEELRPQNQERMEEIMGEQIGKTQSKKEIFLAPHFPMLTE